MLGGGMADICETATCTCNLGSVWSESAHLWPSSHCQNTALELFFSLSGTLTSPCSKYSIWNPSLYLEKWGLHRYTFSLFCLEHRLGKSPNLVVCTEVEEHLPQPRKWHFFNVILA